MQSDSNNFTEQVRRAKAEAADTIRTKHDRGERRFDIDIERIVSRWASPETVDQLRKELTDFVEHLPGDAIAPLGRRYDVYLMPLHRPVGPRQSFALQQVVLGDAATAQALFDAAPVVIREGVGRQRGTEIRRALADAGVRARVSKQKTPAQPASAVRA